MTEYIGEWMRSVAGAALVCGACLALTPKGKVKAVMQLICGLVVISALLSPLMSGGIGGMSLSLAQYRERAAELTESAQKNNDRLSRAIIEEELTAYILDKAAGAGESLESVRLVMRWSSEGCWYPEEAYLAGEVSAAGRSRIGNLIEAELGVPAERQYWSENES